MLIALSFYGISGYEVRRRKYTELLDWDNLAQNCPLPGLGIYIRQKNRDYTHKNFIYLRIEGMRFDKENEQPYFSFKPIKVSSHPSKDFIEQFPIRTIGLFAALKADKVLEALRTIGEEPPEEWVKLIKEGPPIKSWRDYIGKYFLELMDEDLSNNEFEDRCYELLRAIGFNVKQLGHAVTGEYPDGEIHIDDDIVVVYDCKNIHDFALSAEDRRKLNEYVNNAKLQYKGKEVYGIFIAKSFGETQKDQFLFFPISALVYILYKKIKLGREFNLSPIRKIVKKEYLLNQTLIDIEWRT